ncbi:MAG: hypothetical protein [Bacteriophage sp.]|nr:MAG: hypothetical protein [Bacteriophage sp.]
MTTKIVPVIPDKPGIFDIKELYDRDHPSNYARYLPPVNSIVYGEDSRLYRVIESDTEQLTYKLRLIVLPDDYELSGESALIINNENDKLCLFYDPRNIPFRVSVDSRFIVYGEAPSFYRIVLNPYSIDDQKIISKYYDATGNYVSDRVPLTRIKPGINIWTLNPCFIDKQLKDDQEIEIQIFTEDGVLIRRAIVFAKKSIIVNDTQSRIPRIIDIKVKSTQQLDNGDVYILERQSFNSLHIFVEITYEDGSIIECSVDNEKVFLYGSDDFVSSYAGLKQHMLIKYFLSENETSSVPGYDLVENFINVDFDVVVINNQIDDIVKISVFPVWDVNQYGWLLYYRIYGVNDNFTMNVTPYVTITSGNYQINNFSGPQEFIIKLDLHEVDSDRYPVPSIYIQNVWINLFSNAADVKWLLSDASTSSKLYGQDKADDRRPSLFYDKDRNQYFIPSSIFTNKESVIKSYYYNNSPPYNNSVQTIASEPTHFGVRDPISGSMLTSAYISLDDYRNAFSFKNATLTSYGGTTLVIEFVNIMNNITTILYASPVDCINGKYNG